MWFLDITGTCRRWGPTRRTVSCSSASATFMMSRGIAHRPFSTTMTPTDMIRRICRRSSGSAPTTLIRSIRKRRSSTLRRRLSAGRIKSSGNSWLPAAIEGAAITRLLWSTINWFIESFRTILNVIIKKKWKKQDDWFVF